MSLTLPVNGGQINASDVDQLVNEIQRGSGGQETGVYYIHGNASTAGGVISGYILSHNRYTTPVSVSYDTSIALTTLGSITTDTLTQYGFHIWGMSQSVPQAGSKASGYWTIQY